MCVVYFNYAPFVSCFLLCPFVPLLVDPPVSIPTMVDAALMMRSIQRLEAGDRDTEEEDRG